MVVCFVCMCVPVKAREEAGKTQRLRESEWVFCMAVR